MGPGLVAWLARETGVGSEAAQAALRWLVQQRITAVSATSNPPHAAETLDVFSFSLTSQEMRELGAAVT